MKKLFPSVWISLIALVISGCLPAVAQAPLSSNAPVVTETAEALVPKYHVQVNPDYHLFQFAPVGDTTVLIYMQRAYDSKGNKLGFAVHQIAGPWGNNIESIVKRDGFNEAYRAEFEEAVNWSIRCKFLLEGRFDPSVWTGTVNAFVIHGDPVLQSGDADEQPDPSLN